MTDWTRLAKLAGMLGSPHDNERLNAARLLDAALKRDGLTFGDLAGRLESGGMGSGPRVITVEKRAKPNPAWALAQKIIDAAKPRLTTIERRFLNDVVKSCDMTGGSYELTPKQAAWLVMLEKQYLTGPQHKMRRTRPAGPVPPNVLDDLGLGNSPGTFKGPPTPRPKHTPFTRDIEMPISRNDMRSAEGEVDTRLNSGFAARQLDLDDDIPF